jgi:hypothetical protein
VVQVDDLIKPRAKQILPAAVPPFSWSHRIPRSRGLRRRESELSIRVNPPFRFCKEIDPNQQFQK